jgi:flagellar biosynthesis protein
VENRYGSRTGKRVPTAVALTYEYGDAAPPKVAASGRGALAERILELAFANGVPVREDADLAELLATVDIDSEIPTEALIAVAEVLSYVYRLNGTWRDQQADESQQ